MANDLWRVVGFVVVAVIGVIIAAMSKRWLRFWGLLLIVVSFALFAWYTVDKIRERDRATKIFEDNKKWIKENEQKRTWEFVDGIPVIRNSAQGIHYSGCRVIFIASAKTDPFGAPLHSIDDNSEIRTDRNKWPSGIEGKTVKVIGVLHYSSENDPSMGLWPSFYLKTEAIELFPNSENLPTKKSQD